MNDEIKEILLEWKNGVETGKDRNGIIVGGCCYRWNELKLLLDYITNLQQENKEYIEYVKELKDSLRSYHIKNNKLINEIERLKIQVSAREELYEYSQLRIDKAIEYIKENEFYLDYKTGACIKGVMPLLNILQNGSDDNE